MIREQSTLTAEGRPLTIDLDIHPRAAFDLEARHRIFGDAPAVEVPREDLEFWTWYARKIRCGDACELIPIDGVPRYPAPNGKVALWFSGGVESTYTLEQIRDLNPVLLRAEDFPVFTSRHRNIGELHFICAALATSMGFSKIFLGVERHDLLLANTRFAHAYLERHPDFLHAWSRYQPDHQLVSVCEYMHKEEIIAWLWDHKIKITGSCDRFKDGTWCGDCYKCFEAWYTAKAVGIKLDMIPLSRWGWDQYHRSYRDYIDSGFVNNYRNAYQHYARLQMTYHLTFDANDCVR